MVTKLLIIQGLLFEVLGCYLISSDPVTTVVELAI